MKTESKMREQLYKQSNNCWYMFKTEIEKVLSPILTKRKMTLRIKQTELIRYIINIRKKMYKSIFK